ncbi:MAG: sodium:alanine symporter family protein [Acidobacteria bacterium]|nr:sodium:alanine symporter family protein [Acidobacteriota bacterium]
MLEVLTRAVNWASNAVWGPWTIALLLGTGIFLTVRYRFVQITRFPEMLRTLWPKGAGSGEGALSPFQAFMTGLAGSVGTGNIAGVATAIVAGGPGAVFWIWAYGFFATVIKLTEAVLAVRYRAVAPGKLSAGPMHYLEQGLGLRWLGLLYALIAGVASLTTTPFTQPNSIAVVFESELGLPRWICGIALALLTWIVVIGGVRSIGRAAEKLAPAMVGLYLLGGLIVIVAFAGRIPEVFATIFREAFSTRAVGGGALGTAMMVAVRYGLARGIYANEAGYGTAAVAYGSARSARPLEQGVTAMMEVFIVSFFTSSVSALTILLSGSAASGHNSTALVAEAFASVIPFGGLVVLVSALLFGYTTLIGWGYYGEQFLGYVFGERVIAPYRWIYCALIVLGATSQVELVWAWGDLMNGLQIFPNLVGVLALSGLVARLLREDRAPARS